VRAVNLVPGEGRGARAAGGGSRGAYVLLGALAALVVLACLWATANRQAGDRRAQLDRISADATVAEARAAAGAAHPYEAFSRLVKDRVATVSALAGTRFDWAHALREISRLLPADVWLTELTGASGSHGQTPSPTTSVAPAPTFKLDGCTRSQGKVAQLMARLRAVDGVRDVVLRRSEKPESGGDKSCPANRDSDPTFTITISFVAPGTAQAIPATASPGGLR